MHVNVKITEFSLLFTVNRSFIECHFSQIESLRVCVWAVSVRAA